jgi:tellurite resistance protein TerC
MHFSWGTAQAVEIVTTVVQLVFLEGILSIDNAVVLGAMVAVLPGDKPVPYPRLLAPLDNFTARYLGMQRAAALKVGLLGAYLGRGLMLFIAAWVIANPILKIIGAAYLVKLAFSHLSARHKDACGNRGEEDTGNTKSRVSFWMVVVNVELADLAFSLDNVVAAVALSQKLWVVMLGVALGIVTMRFAASIFTLFIRREPILEAAAYIVVLNIGAELLLHEFYGIKTEAMDKFLISALTLLLCLAYAHFRLLRLLADPVLGWLGEGMGHVNALVNWCFRPVRALLGLLVFSVRKMAGA